MWDDTNVSLINVGTANVWGVDEIALDPLNEIPPVEGALRPVSIKTFRFKVTAPAASTTPYQFRWQMKRLDIGEPFGDPSGSMSVTVVAASTRRIVDTLDYLVADDHATQGLTNLDVKNSPNVYCAQDPPPPPGHALSQSLSGNKVHYTYFGDCASASVLRPKFTTWAWDDSYIYIVEDLGRAEQPNQYFPGIWMKRFSDVSPSVDSVVDMFANRLQLFEPPPDTKNGFGDSELRCVPSAPQGSWSYVTRIEGIGPVSLGGELGEVEALRLRFDWPGGCERFWYHKQWGQVKHVRYGSLDSCPIDPEAPGTGQVFNAVLTPKRTPDLSRSCGVPIPLLQY